MDISTIFAQLGIALGLGLLVGLQRESVAARLAGMRTFPLITLFGAVCALLATSFGGFTIAAGLLALAGIVFVGRMNEPADPAKDHGLTTEVAMLLMFGVGASLVAGSSYAVAIAVGGGVAVLLQFKPQLHGIAARFTETDLKAIMQFALISLIILPVLPDRPYDVYGVLNPRRVWLMVVLIVGINLGGYIAYKFFGARAGTMLGGLLGGVISSTATTFAYAKRTATLSTEGRDGSGAAAVVIIIASGVVFARLLLEVAFVAPLFLRFAAPPLAIMCLLFALLSLSLWLYRSGETSAEMPVQANPSELKSALVFGAFYAIILFAAAAAKDRFGAGGLFIVAGLSGLTDVDAITLSTAQLVRAQMLDAGDGWRLIMVAAMSNLVFKLLAVAALASRRSLRRIAPLYGLALLCGALLILLWRP